MFSYKLPMFIFLLYIPLVSNSYLHGMESELTQPLTSLKQSLDNLEKLLSNEKIIEKSIIKKNILPSITLNPLYNNHQDTILQYNVLQQKNNANCGYYALKDTLYISKALETEDSKNLQILLTNGYVYNTDYEVWSKVIAQNRNSKNTEWLNGSELEDLYNNHTPEKPKNTLLWTIDNLDWISESKHYYGLIKTPGFKILKNFRNLNNYAAGFLINNATEYVTKEGGTRAGSGHWIGVVVEKKENIFFYYITDSLNKNRTNDSKILSLKKFLEEANLTTIKIIVLLESNMESLKNSFMPKALNNSNIDQKSSIITALTKINEVIQIAQKDDVLMATEFNKNREILLDYLEQIENTKKTEEEDLKFQLQDDHITIEELRETLVKNL